MKAAIASRKVDLAADGIVIAGRDRTEMPADRVADVIVDRVPAVADVTVVRAAAVDVIATVTVIADHADRVRMDLVPKAHRPRTVTVDRAKNTVTEIPDDTKATDHVKAEDRIETVTDNARRADRADVTAVRAADDRNMHADRVKVDRTAKVDGRKVRADAPIKREGIKATVDRDDKADDRSPNTHVARSPGQQRHRRDLAKKFRDSLGSYSAEASRLNL